jgi:hypothetical protein
LGDVEIFAGQAAHPAEAGTEYRALCQACSSLNGVRARPDGVIEKRARGFPPCRTRWPTEPQQQGVVVVRHSIENAAGRFGTSLPGRKPLIDGGRQYRKVRVAKGDKTHDLFANFGRAEAVERRLYRSRRSTLSPSARKPLELVLAVANGIAREHRIATLTKTKKVTQFNGSVPEREPRPRIELGDGHPSAGFDPRIAAIVWVAEFRSQQSIAEQAADRKPLSAQHVSCPKKKGRKIIGNCFETAHTVTCYLPVYPTRETGKVDAADDCVAATDPISHRFWCQTSRSRHRQSAICR